jgi:hypothetical protein
MPWLLVVVLVLAPRILKCLPVVELRILLELVNHVESLGNFLVPLGHFLSHLGRLSLK